MVRIFSACKNHRKPKKMKCFSLSLFFTPLLTHQTMIELNTQLNALTTSFLSSWSSSEMDVTQLYVSVPKVRKIFKFLNDNFGKMMKERSEDENSVVFSYFTISQKTIMVEIEYLIGVSTTQILINGKERNLYSDKQIKSWNKTYRQLTDFEKKCKKYMVQIITQIPSDLTETISSYL